MITWSILLTSIRFELVISNDLDPSKLLSSMQTLRLCINFLKYMSKLLSFYLYVMEYLFIAPIIIWLQLM